MSGTSGEAPAPEADLTQSEDNLKIESIEERLSLSNSEESLIADLRQPSPPLPLEGTGPDQNTPSDSQVKRPSSGTKLSWRKNGGDSCSTRPKSPAANQNYTRQNPGKDVSAPEPVVSDPVLPPPCGPPQSPSKSKKKEDKSLDHILRALNSLHTSEEKLAALCKKYADLLIQLRNAHTAHKHAERKLIINQRETDQLRAEYNKAVKAKGKLESLCRELAKNSKLIKEESLLHVNEEERKRVELHSKFQEKLKVIETKMSQSNENQVQLKQENIDLTEQLKNLIHKYNAQDLRVKQLIEQRELECELYEAQVQKSQLQLFQEKEVNKREKELLEIYTGKYEEFQSTLSKSNEVFGKFRSELDVLTEKIKVLEKDNSSWQAKYKTEQKAVQTLLAEQRNLKNKNEKLQSLCRALQAERRSSPAPPQEDPSKEGSLIPSKTPPNTPESRSSPTTVQGVAAGEMSHPSSPNEGQQIAGYEVVLRVYRDNPNEQSDKINPDNLMLNEILVALNNQLHVADTNLAHTDTDLAHTDTGLAHTDTDLAHTDTNLAHTDTDLAHTDTNLVHTDTDLTHFDTDVARTDTSLARTDTSLTHTDTDLAHTSTERANSSNDGTGQSSDGITEKIE